MNFDEMMEMNLDDLEKSLESFGNVTEGAVVDGKVVEVTASNVFLDVNCKSEGILSTAEFGDSVPSVGDTVQVFLEKKEDRDGRPVISKSKADEQRIKRSLRSATASHEPVPGKFVKEVPGGLSVDLGGDVLAFCPNSQIDINRVENPSEWIGKTAQFLIHRNPERKSITVSRRRYLEEEIEKARENFFATVKEGDTVEGTVKNFTSYGAFVDLGGFDGLLHLSDMSWGHANSPRTYMNKGDQMKLIVKKIDPENKKVNLSLKDLTTDPWTDVAEVFHPDDVVPGKITKMTDFGIFVELKEGVEGLAHISELSWTKRIKHPRELFNIGDVIQVKIFAIDPENRKISLGVKQLLPNVWDTIEEVYPIGSRCKGIVKKIITNGVFVELEEGVEGFLHPDNVSWTRKKINLHDEFKVNDEIEVFIIDIDKENRRIALGIKQLTEDPWQILEGKYGNRSVADCIVTGVTDFGVFVKIGDSELEGLIPVSQLPDFSKENPKAALDKYKEGDALKAVVMSIDSKTKRISLSVTQLVYNEHRAEYSKYLDSEDSDEKASLGDFIQLKQQGADDDKQ